MNEQDLQQNTPENEMAENRTEQTNAASAEMPGAATEQDETGTGNQETEQLRKELNASKDQYLRLVAEFDNFRKRTAKERLELTQTASKDLMQALLAVLDDSDRAGKMLDTATDIQALKEGVFLVLNKLNHILSSKGLKAMELVAGHDFDPELHEAITEIPAPVPELEGKVVDVIEKGYYLNEKLIRHAKVVVGK